MPAHLIEPAHCKQCFMHIIYNQLLSANIDSCLKSKLKHKVVINFSRNRCIMVRYTLHSHACSSAESVPIGGIHGRVVKVVDFKSPAPYRCEFETRHGLWILSCEEVIQLAYWTLVVLLRCPLMPEIMQGTWGLPQPVKLEHRDMTYIVLMWR
jgi:hypothetical protein